MLDVQCILGYTRLFASCRSERVKWAGENLCGMSSRNVYMDWITPELHTW